MSYLTHQWVIKEDVASLDSSWALSTRDSGVERDDRDHWVEMKPQSAYRLLKYFQNLKTYLGKTDTSSNSSG